MSVGSQPSSLWHSSYPEENGLPKSQEKPLEAHTPAPPRDGGLHAWMTVTATWLVQFCTYGYVSSFGVYQDFYTREFLKNKSPSDISWIGSFQLFMQYALSVVAGRAFDRGYFHILIAIGSIIQVTCMFLLSITQPGQYYQVFLAQAIGIGLGQSLLFLPSITILGHHFKRRRAMATGIAVSGASVGGVIWPIMLNQLIQRLSFANSVRITGGVVGILLLLANVLFRTRNPTKNSLATIKKRDIRSILRDTAYFVSIGGAFCINFGIFFPYFYLQLYAIDKGVKESLAFYSLAIISAGSIFGRLLPNFFADKIGPYNMLIPCLVLSSALAFAMLGVQNFAGVVVFGVLYGFWSGSYVSLIPSLLAQFSTHPGEQGTRMGIAFSVVGISVLVGTPIEGALIQTDTGGFAWHRAIIFCGIMVLVGTAGMAISRQLFLKQHPNHERGHRI